MDPNNAISYRHRRSPSSDRFIGVLSPLSSHSTANVSSSTGDELNEIDVFYTRDFSSGSEPRIGRSGTADHSFRHSISQPEKFGILAALPERDQKIDIIVQKPAVCSPPKPAVCSPPPASFARDISAILKPHSSSEAKYTQSMPRRRFQQSVPVNVPIMPRKARNEAPAKVDEMDEEEVLPPHEMVARVSLGNQKTTFSVLEGVGRRTLKGRDQRQVHNVVWRQTSFLD